MSVTPTRCFALIGGDGAIVHRWRIATHSGRTGDEYMVWLSQLMELSGADRATIDRIVVATVVPPTLFNLRRFAQVYFDIEPLVVTKDLDLGIGVAVPNPAEVGADRLVNSAAALRRIWRRPQSSVDFGTATTFDVILNAAYSGGAIAPGINLAVDALYAASAQLPRVARRAARRWSAPRRPEPSTPCSPVSSSAMSG